MKILPMMNRGIPWLREDGRTFDVVPFQVFRSTVRGEAPMTMIRIGRNLIRLNENGTFDGHEMKSSEDITDDEIVGIEAALDASKTVDGVAPEEAFFQPDTQGHDSETRDWATSKPPTPEQVAKSETATIRGGQVVPSKPRTRH